MEHVDEIVSGYFISLYRELESYVSMGLVRPLKTVFIGGGTPTHVGANYLWWLIRYLQERWGFAYGHEFTVEANPETIAEYPLDEIYDAGVTRLSVGIQSNFDHLLAEIGRNTGSSSVRKGLKALETTRPQKLSFDLLYGVPGQTLEELYTDIERLIEYTPDHISLYQLTPESGTRLGTRTASGKTALPSDGETLQMQEFAESRLARYGFRRYEISNYARDGAVCKHNVAVWNGEDYIGVGVSAVGFINGTRYSNVRTLADYFMRIKTNRLPRLREETLNTERRMRERIAFGIRMIEGVEVDESIINRIRKCDINDEFANSINALEKDGLVESDDTKIKPTRNGLLVHNKLAIKILG
jgi:oxygen-independent coproporphyrinogen III oxidase